MPWVRFDDQYPIHRKVDGLSDAAFRLHTSAIFWSARNLTDGFVPRGDLESVTARVRTPARFAAECVRRGTWHRPSESCDSELCPAPVDNDGWVIHDYWDYQPTREQVIKDRKANADRQKRWRDKHNGSSNAVSNAVSNSTPSRPRPGVVVDVVNQSNGSRRARASPETIEAIISEILDVTGRHITEDWAGQIWSENFADRAAASPAAYVRQAIRSDPDPRKRFLPLY